MTIVLCFTNEGCAALDDIPLLLVRIFQYYWRLPFDATGGHVTGDIYDIAERLTSSRLYDFIH